jgi:hypothetical protein
MAIEFGHGYRICTSLPNFAISIKFGIEYYKILSWVSNLTMNIKFGHEYQIWQSISNLAMRIEFFHEYRSWPWVSNLAMSISCERLMVLEKHADTVPTRHLIIPVDTGFASRCGYSSSWCYCICMHCYLTAVLQYTVYN